MESKAKTFAAYVAEAPEERRATLRKLRSLIKKTAPKAKESMSGGVPNYEFEDEMLCAFASQKQYLALYFCETDVVSKYRSKLRSPNCGKSCVRYRRFDDIPYAVIETMLKEAMKTLRGRSR